MKKYIFLLLAVSIVNLIACSHYDEIQKSPKESMANNDKSHNSGQNCMSCHNEAGNEASSKGFWNVAGTVYSGNSLANNVTVELWSEPNGAGFKIASLVSDTKGNFYTNKIINFNNGCYPIIKSGATTKAMTSKFLGGMSCSNASCHGGTQAKLTIN